MQQEHKKLRTKKLDALYIHHNYFNCLLVYFCLCFTWIRITHDVMGANPDLYSAYLIPFVFSLIMGFGLKKWAQKAVKEMELDHIL